MCQPLLKHNICSTEVVREAFSGLDAISCYILLLCDFLDYHMTGSPGFSHATEIPSLFGAWLNEMRTQILNK